MTDVRAFRCSGFPAELTPAGSVEAGWPGSETRPAPNVVAAGRRSATPLPADARWGASRPPFVGRIVEGSLG